MLLHTYIQSAETTGYSVTTNNLTKVPEVTVCVLYLFIEMRSFPYSYFISRSVECIKRTQKHRHTRVYMGMAILEEAARIAQYQDLLPDIGPSILII